MRHPHAELIHAFAEGAEIEYFYNGEWWLTTTPQWDSYTKHRIKPSSAEEIKAELQKPSYEPVAWMSKTFPTTFAISEDIAQPAMFFTPLYAEPVDQSTRMTNLESDLIMAQEYIKELASEHTVLLVKHRDLESQLSECRKLLATRVEASRLSEANEQIAEMKAQRSMQEKIIKSAYARCRDLEQQLTELQAKRKPLTDE